MGELLPVATVRSGFETGFCGTGLDIAQLGARRELENSMPVWGREFKELKAGGSLGCGYDRSGLLFQLRAHLGRSCAIFGCPKADMNTANRNGRVGGIAACRLYSTAELKRTFAAWQLEVEAEWQVMNR